MRLRDVISFLAFGAIIVGVLGYFGSLGIRVNPPDARTNLSMDIPDINGLVAGSNVLLRGVPVGKVTSVGTTAQTATVDFYVDGRYRIPVDSDVRLENLSALGESYVGLVPRAEGGPMLRNGQRIATDKVIQPASITELAKSVVRVLHQLDPEALKRVISEGYGALPDPTVVLPNISRASTLLRNVSADLHGSGRELLSNFQTLLRNGEWIGPTLSGLTPDVLGIGVDIQDIYKNASILIHRGEPGNIIAFNSFLARVQNLLDDRGPDLKVIGQAFQPKLNDIAGTLMNFDTGQLLSNMLAIVPPDGTITLHVVP